MVLRTRFLPSLFLILVYSVFGTGMPLTVQAQAPSAGESPNILIFVADDAGWRDSGIYGNEAIQTPNIDNLGSCLSRHF